MRRLSLETLERRDMMTVSMSPYDQLLLELINRARANPTAEAARYGIDLNQGLSAGAISTAPKQPLAPNQFLINAAGAHAQDMLNNNFFSHTNLAGKSPSDRAIAAGYSTSVGENIAWGGSTGPINQLQHVFARHQNLFESAGHRQNMLKPSYEEIGVGVRFGPYTYSGVTYNSSMVAEKFGSPGINPVITGVVFTDAANGSANDDNFYTVGEQVASGTITATNTSTGAVFTTSIGVSGGYALQVAPGAYHVVATNGGTGESYLASSILVGTDNVKVDFETTTAGAPSNSPPSLLPIPDLQITLAQFSASASLAANDPDNNQLTYSATVENLAYHLDQTLGLTNNGNVPDDWGGLGEKWLRGADGASYYLTPFGDFFRWDGSGPGSLSGELIATLDRGYYSDLSLLHSAQSGMPGVAATISGTSLTLAMNSSVRGTFVVHVTVSDGVAFDTQSFNVTRGIRLVHHDPDQDSSPRAMGTLLENAGVGDSWQPDARLPLHAFLTAGTPDTLQRKVAGLTRSSERMTTFDADDASRQGYAWQHDSLEDRLVSTTMNKHHDATRWITSSSAGNYDDGEGRRESMVGAAAVEKAANPKVAFHLLDNVFAEWN